MARKSPCPISGRDSPPTAPRCAAPVSMTTAACTIPILRETMARNCNEYLSPRLFDCHRFFGARHVRRTLSKRLRLKRRLHAIGLLAAPAAKASLQVDIALSAGVVRMHLVGRLPLAAEQRLGLADPIVARDAAGEFQIGVEPGDVGRRQRRDLLVVIET